MVGKEKPLKVNKNEGLVVETTTTVIVKQEQNLLSPQSTSSEHSYDHAQAYGLGEDKAILKYEDDSNNETTSSNDKPDR